MGKRVDALWRVAALFWAMVAGFVASIVSFVGLVWMVVDVIWQLVLGSDGLSASSMPAMWVKRSLRWPVDLTVFAFTGDGEFQTLP
jgi:predicted exporter